eukprot:1190359-Prorocentrum_minimum.AAC.2
MGTGHSSAGRGIHQQDGDGKFTDGMGNVPAGGGIHKRDVELKNKRRGKKPEKCLDARIPSCVIRNPQPAVIA